MLIRRTKIRKVMAYGYTQTFLHYSPGKPRSVDLAAYQTL